MGMLYKRFLPVVYRYALAHIGDVHAAEDVTSETFFAIVEHIGETRAHDELSFVAWALGIARNQVAMYFRRLKSRPMAPLSAYDDQQSGGQSGGQVNERDPLDVITARESWAEVVVALQRLTEEQRAVILYRCVLGYSAEDVARLLGKQSGAIRALQFRALSSLARYLKLAETEALAHDAVLRARRRAGED
jgi:RNA polymerase sigma-70 factor (ECF subfamily)